MENINTPETPAQSFINQTPITPKKNIFKYLFFTFFALFLIVTSVSITLLMTKNKNQTSNKISQISENLTTSPTIIPTIDPTIDWKTYTDNKIGFTFKYPSKVSLGQDLDKTKKSIAYPSVEVIVNKISELDEPLNNDSKTAQENKDALERGQIGRINGLESSIKLIKIDDSTNALSSTVLGVFDICDVRLERKIVFYKGDYQIRINYDYIEVPEKTIIPDKYLIVDKANCGDIKFWRNQQEFYNSISTNKLEEVTWCANRINKNDIVYYRKVKEK